jgi:predicted NAD-dependent protein-ADP-ribosyltransferase YbiA (DUF1768 family)
MELRTAEIARIRSIMDNWVSQRAQELEATFGAGGTVSAADFVNIAQRLVSKGYEALPQDDRLTILTEGSDIRLSLQGLGVLQTYCQDDNLQGKPFIPMRKLRTSEEATVDLEEYDTRIKMRHEEVLDAATSPEVRELMANWPTTNKAFRLIKRWTFKGDGMRIDMSMVRSTATNFKGVYKWQRNFLSPNPFKEPVRYEVEVELLRDESTDTAEKAMKVLFKGVGEILRAIQKNSLLLRNSVKQRVITDYTAMNGSDRFRGVNPKAMIVENMQKEPTPGIENIRGDYNVTDKADGLRCLGYCDADGELFLIDMGLNVYRTGLKSDKCSQSLVDGEWVTADVEGNAINHFKVFDIYQASERLGVKNVWNMPFIDIATPANQSRYGFLRDWMTDWNEKKVAGRGVTDENILNVSLKEFLFADPAKPDSIFLACSRVLSKKQLYHTDGLILTANMAPLPSQAGAIFDKQFKWKPAKENSIDFLVSFEKDPDNPLVDRVLAGIRPITGEEVRYKTLRLYVSSVNEGDPRSIILNDLPINPEKKEGKRPQLRAILFNPIDFPDTMASTCHIPVQRDAETGQDYVVTADSVEPIRENSILEMRYDPAQGAGWRWIPMRIRHDKTERLQRNPKNLARTMNTDKVANITWNSIHDPITRSMIESGNDEPSMDEMMEYKLTKAPSTEGGKYFEREEVDNRMLARGLRNFHNHYIKDMLLYKTVLGGGGKKVLDMAVGEAADLMRWIKGKAMFVLGVDPAGDSIYGSRRGAYARYLSQLQKMGRDRVPDMFFVIGDSSKSLTNGDAGSTPEEGDILRSVFGQVEPVGGVPKAVETRAKGILRTGADVATCMFALHYFFANAEMLNGFLKNLQECVREGGYFAGCCFDGKRVFDMLRTTDMGAAVIGNDEAGKMIWSIKKEYNTEDLPADDSSIGHPIDVQFASIGMEHREYLVNFDYLTVRLREIGFEPLTADELREVGLWKSSNLFGESYDMAQRGRINFPMTETEKKFSFLNRWFIFKRRPVMAAAAAAVAASAAATAVAEAATSAVAAPSGPGAGAGAGAGAAAAGAVTAVAPASKKGIKMLEFAANSKTRPVFPIPGWTKTENPLWWLSPSAFFTIVDEEGVNYPSMEHYWMAMKIKHASNKPDLAAMMTSTGGIHTKYMGERAQMAGTAGALTSAEIHDLELKEIKEVLKGPITRGKAGIVYNEDKWSLIREEYIRKGLQYRWTKDADFRAIVEAAKSRNLLLVYKQSGVSYLGGVVNKTKGIVEGGNLVGRIIMELANYPADYWTA